MFDHGYVEERDGSYESCVNKKFHDQKPAYVHARGVKHLMDNCMDDVQPFEGDQDDNGFEYAWAAATRADRDACKAKYYPKAMAWIHAGIRNDAAVVKRFMGSMCTAGLTEEVRSAYAHAMAVFDADIESSLDE